MLRADHLVVGAGFTAVGLWMTWRSLRLRKAAYWHGMSKVYYVERDRSAVAYWVALLFTIAIVVLGDYFLLS
jgi:hypothetical protein